MSFIMPITKSAKKALRQSKKKRAVNIKYKKKTKELIKKVKGLVLENKNEEAKALLPEIQKALDKSAKKNIIKKNTASRKKSRLVKMITSKKTNEK